MLKAEVQMAEKQKKGFGIWPNLNRPNAQMPEILGLYYH
jgi:hypothetical protein